jgi:proteasome accessory factor C
MKHENKSARLFRLLLCLLNGYSRTMEECTGFLDIKKSAFYKYIQELKEFGFDVKQKEGRYWIDASERTSPVLANLLHFSEEEAYVLAKSIDAIEGNTQAARRLKQKLTEFLNRDEAVEAYLKKEKPEIVQIINKAINGRKQILLKDYASGHSLSVKDRLVEPFEFNHDHNLLYAYDTARRENLQFKVCRIGNLCETPFSWKHERSHRSMPVDVFRNSGLCEKEVHFEMNLRAYNLLTEEYPLSLKYITRKTGNRFIFRAPVAIYEGPGRFVLGMVSDVEVKGDQGFKDWMHEKLKILQTLF